MVKNAELEIIPVNPAHYKLIVPILQDLFVMIQMILMIVFVELV